MALFRGIYLPALLGHGLPRRRDARVVVGQEEGLEHRVGRPHQPLDARLPLLLEVGEVGAVRLRPPVPPRPVAALRRVLDGPAPPYLESEKVTSW